MLGVVGLPREVLTMAKYSLMDKFSEKEKYDYSLKDMAAYLDSQKLLAPEEYIEHNVPLAHQKLRVFLADHGLKENPNRENAEALSDTPLRPEAPRENVFSYLQLLCYVLKTSSEESQTLNKFFSLLDHPSQSNISFYQKILKDLDGLVSEQTKKQAGDIVSRADVIWTAHECISLIAYTLHNDYGNLVNELQLNASAFIKRAEQREFPEFSVDSIQEETTYFDLFYRIAATAYACAEIVDMLNAFRKVKKDFSIGHSAKGQYNRMIQPCFRKVEDSDQVTLAYKDGEIIEIKSDEADILASRPSDIKSDDEFDVKYQEALEKYILKNLGDLSKKVFCVDKVDKDYKRRIKNHIKHVAGYWAFEHDRYKNHCVLSKAKLISLLQVIFLSEKGAGFCEGRDHKTMTRGDRDRGPAVRESKGYSTLFGEEPGKKTYRDSYSQQELCIWVDYQALLNTAPIECATYYLDINIATLEAILFEMGTLPPAVIQRRAEQVLNYAVRYLIRKENNFYELSCLLQILTQALGSAPFVTPLFLEQAEAQRLGLFCRLFSAKLVAEKILESIHNWDRSGFKWIVIDPYYTEIYEFKPISLLISWDSNSDRLVLQALNGYQ